MQSLSYAGDLQSWKIQVSYLQRTCVNDAHKARLEFESSEEFSDKMRIRHRIEEKNGEMKTAHGFRRADSAGLVAMRLQAYFTAMVVNMKRIMAVNPG